MSKLSTLALAASLLLAGCSKKSADPTPTPPAATGPVTARVAYQSSANSNASATISLLDENDTSLNWGNGTLNSGATTGGRDFPNITRGHSLRMSVIYQDIYKRPDGTITRTGTGTIHADLLIDGVVKGSIDMDAAQPAFDANGSFKKTITVVAN